MEVPECPIAEHAGSRVVRAGWYGKPPHRRQRWLCRPANGDPAHRFTPVLTRQGAPHAFCVECSTGLEPWEGQAGGRDYRFAAREVGEALAAVAGGASYRAAGEAARRRANRVPTAGTDERPKGRRRDPLRDGQIVANWIDVFTDLLCAEELPQRWPRTLLVDSKHFRIRAGERAGRGFHVLAATGCESAEQGQWAPVPRPWRLEPFGRKDQAAWEAFFGALEGAPRVIVSDADNALACAVRGVFGDRPEHRLCEWHLGRKLREHLPDSILDDRVHPITRALGGALRTAAGWDTLLDAIHRERSRERSLTLIVSWLERYGARIEAQVATRDPRAPNSTGSVEQVLRELDRRIGDRASSFTNRARMSKLLALMTLEMRGEADGLEWADRLRERLYLAGGRARNQRRADDPKGSYSLLA